jgi:hypothetical protein
MMENLSECHNVSSIRLQGLWYSPAGMIVIRTDCSFCFICMIVWKSKGDKIFTNLILLNFIYTYIYSNCWIASKSKSKKNGIPVTFRKGLQVCNVEAPTFSIQ